MLKGTIEPAIPIHADKSVGIRILHDHQKARAVYHLQATARVLFPLLPKMLRVLSDKHLLVCVCLIYGLRRRSKKNF